jgi:predicted amidohydrolase
MTRFEDEEWSVATGQPVVRIFEWKGATIGIAICYDVEFPEYVRKLVQKDVDLILVPSCTDDIHGYWRVRHCAEARGVEGQVYVVMSSIVRNDPAHPEIDAHYKQAGWFTPCDKAFPPGGILALGNLNQEDVATHLLDFALIEDVRKNGTVLNRRDNS